ncbi:hypothetical protein ABEB36_012762 [Hypothenemus hampei]|uniref:Myb/SANT-like DNA-binding domain-containing protein n=1 Tax=Hypothenemus hampei TaxID=57062 RepID=A0ABD1ECB6_HYPHA
MNNVFNELQEYMVFGTGGESSLQPQDFKWNVNQTKILIDYYGKLRKKVGSFEIRNVGMMWQRIAEELVKLNIAVTAKNCHNRWKVIERNYKKFVDDQNKTVGFTQIGRGRKFFEYEAEMAEIFGKKTNVHPEILLNSDTIDMSLENGTEELEEVISQTPAKVLPKLSTEVGKVSKTKRTSIKGNHLEKIRLDRKIYYNERLEIEKQKLEEIKKKTN